VRQSTCGKIHVRNRVMEKLVSRQLKTNKVKAVYSGIKTALVVIRFKNVDQPAFVVEIFDERNLYVYEVRKLHAYDYINYDPIDHSCNAESFHNQHIIPGRTILSENILNFL